MFDVFILMNWIGLFAFAAVGALKGKDAGLDLFGIVVLGVLTALGGGIIRDTLVGEIPAALTSMTDVSIVLCGVFIAVVLSRSVEGALIDHPALLTADAIGLAAFAATGALVGIAAELTVFGVVVLATLTGVGGGSLCDLLLTRVPVVLREDFYATPAVIGGGLCWVAVVAGFTPTSAAIGSALFVFGLRMLAVRYDWRLPTF
ncbi:trimeric intracellular cation channel family protein [Natronocalculus amylovorans]|uniref:Trimeric intracellular cation channel family protein n=1 Tax=Natronocalculus amylovorans TaxID=2917812 RepID=A0AAE3FVN3_9EURY|nr:trimeric intracellular cation channel family protein [Natronocalculus amylovorans]MCL9815464.1 trimeric intracellular cation channel family protein [Natronocalculus amylovorans]NUE02022.1 trimeric intracellular cation channel family protein [Halorubraceae archaeon YAN]